MATLEAFEAAARLGSFSAAAEALGLTPGAISRQMAVLEGDLGLALFVRSARGVALTPAGHRLQAASVEALALLLAAARDLRRPRGRGEAGRVRISVTPSFGARWLLPRLARFRAIHPQVEVTPVAENRLVDLIHEGFDIAVRYMPDGAPPDGVQAEPWLREELVPVAAPSLVAPLSMTGHAGGIDRLAGLSFLHDTSEAFWRHWLAAVGRLDLLPPHGIVFNDYNLAAEAAVAGLGVLIGRTALITDELREGRLVELVRLRVPSPRAYHLLRPAAPPTSAAAAFWLWLSQAGSPGSP